MSDSSGDVEVSQATPSMKSPSEREPAVVRLSLFIAMSTPNSIRAQRNLMAALARIDALFDQAPRAFDLEVIDVFTDPRRALNDGIIVTPTLIAHGAQGRISLIGDFADEIRLGEFLEGLSHPREG
jgi:circadian clock protein KaiB